jgi:membrane protein DedA with SNARE-associated domain
MSKTQQSLGPPRMPGRTIVLTGAPAFGPSARLEPARGRYGIAAYRGGVLASLVDLVTSSSWTYLLLFGLAAGDAVLPVLPSETALIAAGILCELDKLGLVPAIGAAWAGAVVGDNASYLLGRHVGGPAARRLFRSEKAEQRFRWAEGLLRRRGGQIVLTARFVPGGRTAAPFSAGLLRYSWLRFFPLTVVAGAAWATSGILLGYFGGRVVEKNPWFAIVLLLALAAVAGLGFEAYRRIARR